LRIEDASHGKPVLCQDASANRPGSRAGRLRLEDQVLTLRQ
jgi:hypothetical protein